MSAQDYRDQISKLGLDSMELSASSVVEAKHVLFTVKQAQAELRNIKRELDIEVKFIRANYQQQMSSAASGTSAVLTIFGKRKMAGSARADAKRHLATQRDKQLQDYQKVKLTIDNLLMQLEKAKLQFQQYVQDNK